MKNTLPIRAAKREDIAAIAAIAEDTELFPGDMLPEMIAPFLNDQESSDIWLVTEHDGAVIAFTFCEPERMTDGTANMLAIGVRPDLQGQSIGAQLTARLERDLRARGDRLLLVETSGLSAFEQTRGFYLKHGFEHEATIREFYEEGDDKVVFRKIL